MAIALAQRGFRVYAIDSAEAMIEQAHLNAMESRVTDLLSFDIGDVYTLALEDESFDLVLAIGVIPWLERADLAIQQMASVTKHGGYIILTYANRAGLVSLLDPWTNPALVPLKRRLKEMFERFGHRRNSPTMIFHSNRFIDSNLAGARMVKIKSMTRGFSCSFRHKVLPEPFGTALHHLLQRLADRNLPGFRSMGMTYFVLASKAVTLERHPKA
jgi:ubiquinone/menaquinone biosynthesis C-methylase UbiE